MRDTYGSISLYITLVSDGKRIFSELLDDTSPQEGHVSPNFFFLKLKCLTIYDIFNRLSLRIYIPQLVTAGFLPFRTKLIFQVRH